MKKAIIVLITLFLSLFSLASAQNNNVQKWDQDIRIAEGILNEIFGNQHSSSDVLPRFSSRSISGEYIPGYGVHFTVSPGFSNFVHIQNSSSDKGNVHVEIQQDDESSESEKIEEVKENIYEYMTKYASLISGLPDGETIRVTYAKKRTDGVSWVIVQGDQRNEKSQPGISVWAKVSDLKQFKNGAITEQELRNRIKSNELDGEEMQTDFNVFASVLETALNSTDTEYLRVSRRPQMEYLPGLGVRYRVQVSTRPSMMLEEFKVFGGNIEFQMDTLRKNLDQSLRLMEASLDPLILKIDSMIDLDLSDEDRERIQEELQEQRRTIQIHKDSLRDVLHKSPGVEWKHSSVDSIDLRTEADAIMDQLRSVIEDYGSTLSSLNDDEMLMISINWSGRSDDLPERTEVRIKKSALLRGEGPDIQEIDRR